jgi:uncharacterized membrane protein
VTAPTAVPGGGSRRGDGRDAAVAIETLVSRVLVLGTYLGIGLVLLGVAGMLAAGMDPLDATTPPFSLAEIPAQMLALDPLGFLWAGLLTFLVLPIGRVVVSGVGFLAAGERAFALVSALVVVVVVLSIVAATVLQP